MTRIKDPKQVANTIRHILLILIRSPRVCFMTGRTGCWLVCRKLRGSDGTDEDCPPVNEPNASKAERTTIWLLAGVEGGQRRLGSQTQSLPPPDLEEMSASRCAIPFKSITGKKQKYFPLRENFRNERLYGRNIQNGHSCQFLNSSSTADVLRSCDTSSSIVTFCSSTINRPIDELLAIVASSKHKHKQWTAFRVYFPEKWQKSSHPLRINVLLQTENVTVKAIMDCNEVLLHH